MNDQTQSDGYTAEDMTKARAAGYQDCLESMLEGCNYEQATILAQQSALEFHEGRQYTPRNVLESKEFKPHLWVVEAIRRSAAIARKCATMATRLELRANARRDVDRLATAAKALADVHGEIAFKIGAGATAAPSLHRLLLNADDKLASLRQVLKELESSND